MARPRVCATFRTCFWVPGLGPESYAIIEQGRIGQILSNKPQDRRNVIEEAAGITKFKTRKRLAEAQTGKRQAEPVARLRHSGRSHAPGELAEAPSRQNQALRRTEDAKPPGICGSCWPPASALLERESGQDSRLS